MFGKLVVMNNQWSVPNVKNVETNGETGFRVTFNNGFVVSVQWGFGNYCENRRNMEGTTSKDAEVAVLHRGTGNFVPLMDQGYVDDIAGWVSPEECANLMNIVSNLNKDFDYSKTNPLKFRDRSID